jgi:predicted DNA-binding ribbon-helix-helix protein
LFHAGEGENEIAGRETFHCVAGHKTSVSLEEAFWSSMKEICGERSMTLSELVGEIDGKRKLGNLSSAIRLFVLDHFRTRAAGPAGASGIDGASSNILEAGVG